MIISMKIPRRNREIEQCVDGGLRGFRLKDPWIEGEERVVIAAVGIWRRHHQPAWTIEASPPSREGGCAYRRL